MTDRWVFHPKATTCWPYLGKPFFDSVFFDEDTGPTEEQGELFAEALNAHEATGLTPSQLQARVAELEAALREYRRLSRILVNSIDDVMACNREADRLLGAE